MIGFYYVDRIVLNDHSAANLSSLESSAGLATAIRMSILKLKAQHITESNGIQHVDYDGMKTSVLFQDYVNLSCQLATVDLSSLSGESSRKAFFINIYNSLVIHGFVNGLLVSGSFMDRLKFYASTSYRIGNHIYSLNDLENGLLRANKKSAAPFTSPPFADKDARLQFSCTTCDARIHFVLNCGARSCPPVAIYSYDNDELEEQLNAATEGFISDNTSVDMKNNTISLSMIFQWYSCDFGTTPHEVIRWVQLHATKELSDNISSMLLQCPSPTIRYTVYDWNVNS